MLARCIWQFARVDNDMSTVPLAGLAGPLKGNASELAHSPVCSVASGSMLMQVLVFQMPQTLAFGLATQRDFREDSLVIDCDQWPQDCEICRQHQHDGGV